MPKSPNHLEEINARLSREVAAHEATLRELEAVRRDLELRVAERTKELSLVKARFETALRGAKVHVFSQDRDLRYTWAYAPHDGDTGDDMVGLTDQELLPEAERDSIIALKHSVLETGEAAISEVSYPLPQGPALVSLHVDPTYDANGKIDGIMCAAVDITERKEGEAHLRMLMRELTHRSKNLLAVIQAMARQTARHSGTTESFLDQFGARLQALAMSHDLLVQESWHGASLEELVRSQLGHHLEDGQTQISIDGPAVLLKPEAAQGLGLALHELATNAIKYGALSVPAGSVSISWKRLKASDGHGIEVIWRESEGPEVTEPAQRGFGTMVIERHLARSLDSEVALTFERSGVLCRIIVPITQFLASR